MTTPTTPPMTPMATPESPPAGPRSPRRIPWTAVALVVPTVLAVPVALSKCPTQRPTPTRIVVTVTGGDTADHAAGVEAIEAALVNRELAAGGLRSSACPQGGVVVMSTSAPTATALNNARGALAGGPAAAAAGLRVDVAALGDVIADFAVRGPDPFTTRQAIDTVLLPALRSIAGAESFEVHGGRRERQVALDAERLLATDVALPEVLAALRAASSLEQTVLKTTPLVRLADVAAIGDAPAGEALRRDGAVQVVVRGHRRAPPPPPRRSMLDAAKRVTLPAGITLAALDDASDEAAAVRLRGASPADVDELRRALLAIPGVRPVTPSAELRLTLDKAGARAHGLATDVAAQLVRAADDGVVLDVGGAPVRVMLAAATTPEALLSVVVARRDAGASGEAGRPVRLFDIARSAGGSSEHTDRLDRHPAVRVRLRFDVGARKAALAEVDAAVATWAKARPAAFAVVERDHDASLFDDLCP
jgi:hypothetical protein